MNVRRGLTSVVKYVRTLLVPTSALAWWDMNFKTMKYHAEVSQNSYIVAISE